MEKEKKIKENRSLQDFFRKMKRSKELLLMLMDLFMKAVI